MRSILRGWSSGIIEAALIAFETVGRASSALALRRASSSEIGKQHAVGSRRTAAVFEKAKLPVDGLGALRLQIQQIEVVADSPQTERPEDGRGGAHDEDETTAAIER